MKYPLLEHHKVHFSKIGIREISDHLDAEPHELEAAKILWRATLPKATAEVIETKALGHVAARKQQFLTGAPIPSAQHADPVVVEDAKNRELQSLAECLRHIHHSHLPEIASRADDLKSGILASHQELVTKIQTSHDDLESAVAAVKSEFATRADKWEQAAVNAAHSLDTEVTDILHSAKKATICISALLSTILIVLIILAVLR